MKFKFTWTVNYCDSVLRDEGNTHSFQPFATPDEAVNYLLYYRSYGCTVLFNTVNSEG